MCVTPKNKIKGSNSQQKLLLEIQERDNQRAKSPNFVCTFFPNLLLMSDTYMNDMDTEGEQHSPPERLPIWHTDYFESELLKKQLARIL